MAETEGCVYNGGSLSSDCDEYCVVFDDDRKRKQNPQHMVFLVGRSRTLGKDSVGL